MLEDAAETDARAELYRDLYLKVMWRREKKKPIAKVTAASFDLRLGVVNKVDRWVEEWAEMGWFI